VALAACGPTTRAPTYATTTAPIGPQGVAEVRAQQPIGTQMPQTNADMCKAGELQWLVGRQRSEIPVPVDVVNRRVTCTACPVTEDFSPYRLNIFYDRESGRIERISCG